MNIKKGIIPFLMIVAGISASASNNTIIWSYSRPNKYEVLPIWKVEPVGKEESAYVDTLKVLDELNRKKGIEKRYLGADGFLNTELDYVDVVPVYVGKMKSYSGKVSTVAANKFYTPEIIKKAIETKDESILSTFSTDEQSQNIRYYFGNGNAVKDVIIEDSSKFDKSMAKHKNDKNIDFILDGYYQSLNAIDDFNTLEITKKEYLDNFTKDPHSTAFLTFIQKKLKDVKGVDAKIKNGDLYTTTSDGKDHRILWKAQPISYGKFHEDDRIEEFIIDAFQKENIKIVKNEGKIAFDNGSNSYTPAIWEMNPDSSLENYDELKKFVKDLANDINLATITKLPSGQLKVEKDGKYVTIGLRAQEGKNEDQAYYQNIFFNQFNVYNTITDKGRFVYTNDGNIIFEDLFTNGKLNPQIKNGYNFEKLTNENLKSKSYGDRILKDFVSLSHEEFIKTWSLTEDEFNNIKGKLEEGKAITDKINTVTADNKPAFDELYNGWSSALSTYISKYSSDIEKQAIFNGTSLKAKADMERLGLNLKEYQAKLISAKKYIDEVGEYQGGSLYKELTQAAENIDLKRISNADIAINTYGRNIEFRGKGRIDGTVDLGNSNTNILTIAEPLTGAYGTNIILGANAKLKNIKLIEVGGQVNAVNGGTGISGRSSLAIEVDATKKDANGNYYQHALKDTWAADNKILFIGGITNINDRNDYVINFVASSLNEDGTIDLGRPITVTAPAYAGDGAWNSTIQKGDLVDYTLNFFTDSIAHKISIKDAGNEKDGTNAILDVKIKDHLKGLSNTENKVFKSLATSGHIGTISNTLTTANKKTSQQSTAEEVLAERQKMYNLINDLTSDMSAEEVYERNSSLELGESDKIQVIHDIEKIKTAQDIIDFKAKVDALTTYKKAPEIKGIIKEIQDVIRPYTTIIPPDGPSYSTEGIIIKKMANMLGGEEQFKLTLDKLILDAQKNPKFKEFIKYMEENSQAGKAGELILGSGYSASPLSKKVIRKIEDLMTPNPSTWYSDGRKLIQLIMSYRYALDDLKEFDGYTVDNIYAGIINSLNETNTNSNPLFPQWLELQKNIFFTQRQTESLKELKLLIDEIENKNIYSKVNKISKDRMEVFQSLPIETKYQGETIARGGAISGRYAKNNFKGTIYSAYGLYETPINTKLSLGFTLGGGTSNHHEIQNDRLNTPTTKSTIKGTSAHIGGYGRYNVAKNLDLLAGIDAQHTDYKVTREWRNNYQDMNFNGKVKTNSFGAYTGINYKYPLNETLDINAKGLLSYTVVSQGKAKEKEALGIETKAQKFGYTDAQIGFGLTKTIYSTNIKNSLSGTVSIIQGLSGYDNKNLTGNFVGSPNTFGIVGEKYTKTSSRLTLDYNAYYNTGFNFGIEGSYTKNSDEDNISVGVKAGYRF